MTQEGSLQVSTPLFQHDCKCCTFLGTSPTNMDLYFCKQGGASDTVIARFSSDGPDYKSGMVFRHRVPELGQAYELARLQGLVK
jgi:hypothetical protein